eukprot:5739944-Prymnesium_polylepis.1
MMHTRRHALVVTHPPTRGYVPVCGDGGDGGDGGDSGDGGVQEGAPIILTATAVAFGGFAEVAAALRRFGLAQYAEAFDAQGYDDLPFLRSRPHGELHRLAQDTVGMLPGHARKVRLQGVESWSFAQPADRASNPCADSLPTTAPER